MLVTEKRRMNNACQWTGDNVEEMRKHLGDVDPEKFVGEIPVPWEPEGQQAGEIFIFKNSVIRKNDWVLTSLDTFTFIRTVNQNQFDKMYSSITVDQ